MSGQLETIQKQAHATNENINLLYENKIYQGRDVYIHARPFLQTKNMLHKSDTVNQLSN